MGGCLNSFRALPSLHWTYGQNYRHQNATVVPSYKYQVTTDDKLQPSADRNILGDRAGNKIKRHHIQVCWWPNKSDSRTQFVRHNHSLSETEQWKPLMWTEKSIVNSLWWSNPEGKWEARFTSLLLNVTFILSSFTTVYSVSVAEGTVKIWHSKLEQGE